MVAWYNPFFEELQLSERFMYKIDCFSLILELSSNPFLTANHLWYVTQISCKFGY